MRHPAAHLRRLLTRQSSRDTRNRPSERTWLGMTSTRKRQTTADCNEFGSIILLLLQLPLCTRTLRLRVTYRTATVNGTASRSGGSPDRKSTRLNSSHL